MRQYKIGRRNKKNKGQEYRIRGKLREKESWRSGRWE
jgi:hypothetical protein